MRLTVQAPAVLITSHPPAMNDQVSVYSLLGTHDTIFSNKGNALFNKPFPRAAGYVTPSSMVFCHKLELVGLELQPDWLHDGHVAAGCSAL